MHDRRDAEGGRAELYQLGWLRALRGSLRLRRPNRVRHELLRGGWLWQDGLRQHPCRLRSALGVGLRVVGARGVRKIRGCLRGESGREVTADLEHAVRLQKRRAQAGHRGVWRHLRALRRRHVRL